MPQRYPSAFYNVCVIVTLSDYFDYYETLEYQQWRRLVPSILKKASGYRELSEKIRQKYEESLVPLKARQDPGGGVLPYKRLMGMCRLMGSHFHDWIDYNGVAFLVELLEWGRTFSGFLG